MIGRTGGRHRYSVKKYTYNKKYTVNNNKPSGSNGSGIVKILFIVLGLLLLLKLLI